jgi:hypothetical protein
MKDDKIWCRHFIIVYDRPLQSKGENLFPTMKDLHVFPMLDLAFEKSLM